ncbi:MAG TPA: FmdB family zinc ribbon protein [Terriglobia bacterium]|nr:FmdB family zinc ribbon protein [Terriglobia bacterium]
MPYYEYECPICKTQRGDMRCVAQRHDAPRCPQCAVSGKRVEMVLIPSRVNGFVKNPAAKS